MNALHLLWIVPLFTGFGYAICAVLTAGKWSEENTDRDANY